MSLEELACELQRRWILGTAFALKLARALLVLDQEIPGSYVISGYRTCAEQQQLEQEGRPAAPCDVSTHTSCPATGADLRLGVFPTTAVKARFGRIVLEAGLRWGGGSPIDPDTGIPLDWNHVDDGPRARA